MLLKILAFLLLIVFAVAVFADSMTKDITHDEQMYCAAPYLILQGKVIYKDFSYIAHPPCYPLIIAAIYRSLSTTHYLLIARCFSAFCDIIVLLCLFATFTSIFKAYPKLALFLGLTSTVIYLFNPLVDFANGRAWNHDLTITLVILSLYICLSSNFFQKSSLWRIVLIAVLLTLATWIRITTAIIQLIFFLFLLFHPALKNQRFKTFSILVLTTLFFSFWPLWIIMQAPRAFILNIVYMPILNAQWLTKIGMIHDKFTLLQFCFIQPVYLSLLVIVLYVYFVFACRPKSAKIPAFPNILLTALLPLAFFLIAFIPPTMWEQYLAMPVPFLIISLAYPLLYFRTQLQRHFKIACIFLSLASFVAIATFPVVIFRIPLLLNPHSWPSVVLHTTSLDIAKNIKSNELKEVLTLAPLYAIEGGSGIYPQFSAGPFAYRIADKLSLKNQQTANVIGQDNIEKLLKSHPPAAIITGTELKILDDTLLSVTIKQNPQAWTKKSYPQNLTVYFKK